jgi:hypothetical protein
MSPVFFAPPGFSLFTADFSPVKHFLVMTSRPSLPCPFSHQSPAHTLYKLVHITILFIDSNKSRLTDPFTVLALIFVPQANEKYFDLGGAIGFLSTTAISLYYPSLKLKFWDGVPGPLPLLKSFAPRQLLLTAALSIWSVRLGSFLVQVCVCHYYWGCSLSPYLTVIPCIRSRGL